jgi:hypothetical protein
MESGDDPAPHEDRYRRGIAEQDGLKVTDAELASVNLRPAKSHVERNYSMKPSG